MATVKILSVVKRVVTVDATWEDGLVKSGLVIPGVPVEDFAQAQAYLFQAVSNAYVGERAAADAILYANPTPDPMVLAAVGHTFDDAGNILS
jgi:hypothetical protein